MLLYTYTHTHTYIYMYIYTYIKKWEYLYAGQETIVRTPHGTTDWFKVEKGEQGYLLSPCLFNLYAEHSMRNARLDEL